MRLALVCLAVAALCVGGGVIGGLLGAALMAVAFVLAISYARTSPNMTLPKYDD